MINFVKRAMYWRASRRYSSSNRLQRLIPAIILVGSIGFLMGCLGYQPQPPPDWAFVFRSHLFFGWQNATEMTEGKNRSGHTATWVPEKNKVVVVGGYSDGVTDSVQLFQPVGSPGTWEPGAKLMFAREDHTATLLDDGGLLVAGGQQSETEVPFTELYDVTLNEWTRVGNVISRRAFHTATKLADGKVLISGGSASNVPLASAEIYDPADKTWSETGSLSEGRSGHTATLLANGKVLIAGGLGSESGELTSTELYDPATGLWSKTGDLTKARIFHTANLLPNGQVMVAGGYNKEHLASVELYDPTTGLWRSGDSLSFARSGHTASLLGDWVHFVGGSPNEDADCSLCFHGAQWTPVEDYHVGLNRGKWQTRSRMSVVGHETTVYGDKLLVTGGDINMDSPYKPALLYQPTWIRDSLVNATDLAQEITFKVGPLNTARYLHSTTRLPGGKLLAAGGIGDSDYLSSVELYDPEMDKWMGTGSMGAKRSSHSATLLHNGLVLVAGGFIGSTSLTGAELYDPETGVWRATASLNVARDSHEATLLPDGRVLISGGYGISDLLDSAEIYDPVSEKFTLTGSMGNKRFTHTATLLKDGTVLAAGGQDFVVDTFVSLDSAEIYDPSSGMWQPTGSLSTARHEHSATILFDGKVLAVGGMNGELDSTLDSVELFNPDTGMWERADSLQQMRQAHTATALPNGRVLVTGGASNSDALISTELYDPLLDRWDDGHEDLEQPGRVGHTATLLTDLNVLVVGGTDLDNAPLDVVDILFTDMKDYTLSFDEFVSVSPSKERFYGRFDQHNDEIAEMFLLDPVFWLNSIDLLILWSPNFRALQDDALLQVGLKQESLAETTFITQEQMDALDNYFDYLKQEASPELKQSMEEEGDLLPPYDDFVGLSVLEAREQLFDGLNTKELYTITPTAGTNGKISPDTIRYVIEGQPISFTIEADEGFQIEDVLVDGVSQGAISSYTFENVLANHTINANFVEKHAGTYTITPSAGLNGSISPSTVQTVSEGDSITFTIAAEEGYSILDVVVDGDSKGPVGSYTFSNVDADHTIKAAFSGSRHRVFMPIVIGK